MVTDSKRLFVAVRPPPSVNAMIREIQHDVQCLLNTASVRKPGRIRWTPEDQIHVTVIFAAAFPAARVGELSAALAETSAAFPPIEIALAEPRARPLLGKPQLLWLPVTRGTEPLRELSARLSNDFKRLQPEVRLERERRFVPHLTLGRVSKGVSLGFSRAIRASLKTGLPPAPPWRADRIDLIESTLGIGGPRHTLVHSFPLAARSEETV